MNNTVYYDSAASDDVRRQHLYDGQLFVFSPRRSILNFVDFATGHDRRRLRRPRPEDRARQHGRGKLCRTARQAEARVHPSPGIEAAFDCDPGGIWAAISKRPISTFPGCAAQRAATISRQVSPMPGTPTETPGIRRRNVSSIGGFRSTSCTPTMRWRFIRVIGASRSRTAPQATTTTPGTSCIAARMSRSSSRKTRGLCRVPPSRCSSIRKLGLICPVGGVILFSAAQMHSSVPNISGVTRFSIDFRSVHLDDVIERNGAPNIDAGCTGTVMRDFMRGIGSCPAAGGYRRHVRRWHCRRRRADLHAEKRLGAGMRKLWTPSRSGRLHLCRSAKPVNRRDRARA